MTAEAFGALSDKVIAPAFHFAHGEVMKTGHFRSRGLSFEEVDDDRGFAFGGPALDIAAGFGIRFRRSGFAHGRLLSIPLAADGCDLKKPLRLRLRGFLKSRWL